MGNEVIPRKSHNHTRRLLIFLKFRKLRMPISSHSFCACWASTSLLVGELKHCIQRLLAPSNNVPKKLIRMCSPRPVFLTSAHGPTWRVPIPSLTVSVMLVHIVMAALAIRIMATTKSAVWTPNGHVIARCPPCSPIRASVDDRAGCHGNHPSPLSVSRMRCV